ncbi:hypothetical protein IV203_034764 [Nitzschia inconspicua]|uniref:Uncharacterized protein n=1 Tax=Nitzschia inconspicua TaxID=303405 RepID=A0A9K3K5J2_9STRA|nr:hypothetical protein IV203_000019 [Nitzschia inconspicua]KAG7359666.1 hypothetical protein IV203_034764 [Nitzschia inconspicua]
MSGLWLLLALHPPVGLRAGSESHSESLPTRKDFPSPPSARSFIAAEHCSCPVWVATGGTTQCSHLLLVQGGFCRENWGARWHQRTSLGKSENKGNSWEQIQRLDAHPLEGDDLSMQDGGFGDGNESVSPQQEAVATTPGSRPETVALVNSPSAEYGLSEMHTIARDLVNSIDKVRDKTKKDLLLGTLVKLADVANGNMEQFHNESLLDALHGYLGQFSRTMPSQEMFSQNYQAYSQHDYEGPSMDNQHAALKKWNPTWANGGRRYRSRNERTMDRMRDSNKRKPTCTLCLQPGHRVGKCPKIHVIGASIIGHENVVEYADRLGNPRYYLVEDPCRDVKELIKAWMKGGSRLPPGATHVVVHKLYYSARKQESFQNSVAQVSVWGEACMPMDEYCPAYYPDHEVAHWMANNCRGKKRKKHILSCLQTPVQEIAAQMYDYG